MHISQAKDDTSRTPNPQDRTKFDFQQNWFEMIRPEWEERTATLRGIKLNILEVGCFEGASTTWMLDNLMNHPGSTMTVIDTFEGGMEHQETGDKSDKYHLGSLESRFWSNVAKCDNTGKLHVMKANSDDALLTLRRESSKFDFIYIDASHVATDVLHDAVLCWRMLNVYGKVVFDDYSWKGYMEDCYNPRLAVESFLQCAAPELQSEETESQMWVTKVPNHIPATPNPDPDLYYWDKGLAKKP